MPLDWSSSWIDCQEIALIGMKPVGERPDGHVDRLGRLQAGDVDPRQQLLLGLRATPDAAGGLEVPAKVGLSRRRTRPRQQPLLHDHRVLVPGVVVHLSIIPE